MHTGKDEYMPMKWIGAIMVVSGCGSWGIMLAAAYRRQEAGLLKLAQLLNMMQWELRYRLTSVPDLCRMAAKDASGMLRCIFLDLARDLDRNLEPDVGECMRSVLSRYRNMPPKVKRILRQLGRHLGRFDLEGQLEGMAYVIGECGLELQSLKKDREIRLRSYQTLALCAGFGLVILFL